MFSRVHVDDISLVLSASIAAPRPGAVYNVADDKPEAGHVVTEFACGLLGLKPPPLVSFEESGMRSPCSCHWPRDSMRDELLLFPLWASTGAS